VRKSVKKILDEGPLYGSSLGPSTHVQIEHLNGVHTSVGNGGASEPASDSGEANPRPPGHAFTARTENIARTLGYGCFGKKK